MRVRVIENVKVFSGHKPVRLAADQEVSGELAAMLLERAPRKVVRLDEEPADEGTGGDDPPASLEEASTAAEVLAWVGEDPERAADALEAEESAEKPRSTLVKQLRKLTES
ncbi:hypothetical protein [Streptomyces sp. bgisy154]|uniref:hypothetical protein n=1 Tax=Streptomyces sp. bgisy154 TaxID=3413794 RepID=UPI003D73307F